MIAPRRILALAALLTSCASVEASLEEDGAPHTPPPDDPMFHGMVLFGTDHVLLSHLPMWHTPHAYQVLLSAELVAEADRPDPKALLREEREAHGSEQLYTLAPRQDFRLPDLQAAVAEGGAFQFRADVVRGHFDLLPEQRAEVAIPDVLVRVRTIHHFRRFGASGPRDRWVLFGQGDETYLAHLVGREQKFDQILGVTVPPGTALPLLVRIDSQGTRIAPSTSSTTTTKTATPILVTPDGTADGDPLTLTIGRELWTCPGSIGGLPCRDLD